MKPTREQVEREVVYARAWLDIERGRGLQVTKSLPHGAIVALADDLAKARALLERYRSPGSSIELNAEVEAFLERTK